ncbi:MAG: glycoside hydrolase family 2 TIM barrel-domain containing protein [Candidatus Cryptobacteroides sp.]
MLKRITAALIALALCVCAWSQNTGRYLLGGWKFHPGPAEGAEEVLFDDSCWESVTIPHDWAISGPFDKEIDKQVVAIEQNGETAASEKTGRSGSLPWIGEGWYRLKLDIPEGYSYAELIFDGAMAEPRVYVDGKEVGYWAYGYSTFNLELSRELTPGTHTLAVHLQNVEESSRWYPGAGLYRPVRLILGQQSGFKTFGTFVRTESADKQQAVLRISSELRCPMSPDMHRKYSLYAPDGTQVSMVYAQLSDEDLLMEVADPQLWSPETPQLYKLVCELYEGERVLDRLEIPTGIRTISYGPDGFLLNGQPRKFKGVCLHHDLGPLGAAFNKSAFRRQVALLKEIGCDAIRTSHNSPEPWQLDICDEMGMLVMAESVDMWRYPKCKNGYCRFFDEWWERDFTNLVLVCRNHPSVVMWSIGNEIPEQGDQSGLELSLAIQDLIHKLDPTRPCTQGLDRVMGAIWSGTLQAMDVPGCNYRLHYYRNAYEAASKGFLLGSETTSTVSSRGVYKFPVHENHSDTFDDGQVSSYDLQCCVWSNLPDDDWMWQDKAPWVIGEFVWTGFDYLGEPTPYDEYWPSRSSYFGIYDLAGLPKDRAYLYRVHWAPEKETLHLLPHWTWPGREGETTPVFCYTSYPEAELFINGVSQGRRRKIDLSLEEYEATLADYPTPWGDYTKFVDPQTPPQKNRLGRCRLMWNETVYQPGELKVVAYDEEGKVAATKVVRTAGKPHHLELKADRVQLPVLPLGADGLPLDTPELSFITVRVVDRDGNLCPDAYNTVIFETDGDSAFFNSCCNGDATSTEVFTEPVMKAFHGELVVVMQATSQKGITELTAKSRGLKAATLNLEVR